MAAPRLQPPALSEPVGTPADEWAQETVQAIGPDARTGVVTDAHGNPTTDHSKSALAGEPGIGMNAEKTAAQLDAQRSAMQPLVNSAPIVHDNVKTLMTERPQTEPAPKVYTDALGNPTTNPHANALGSVPGTGAPLSSTTDKSLPPTPAPQLPGGWIRGPESRQNSVIIPETSLYEDVSEALGTVGKAAFSALPASVVGSLSNNQSQGEANQAPATSTESKPSSPPRSGSPGLISRAQGMITGLLARPASPAAKLPAPDAPTTTGDAALVGGGAVANTADRLGERIAAGQDLGGHDPKGVKETEQDRLEKEASAKVISPDSANTAARFLDAGVPTPDVNEPPRDPGIAGSVFPALPDEGKKTKGSKLGSSLSPDLDVQEAARRSNQDFTVPITSPDSQDAKSQTVSEKDRPQPTVTKASDPGVKEMLMDVKDMVSAPFAGSRASQEMARSSDVASPTSPGKAVKSLSPAELATGANPEGIRTTANPHTAHTGLPPTKEEANDKHVGGTAVIHSPVMAKHTGTDRKDALSGHKDTRALHKEPAPATHEEHVPTATHKESASSTSQNDESTETDGVPIQGISSHGAGQGAIYAGEGGALTQRSNPTVNTTSPPGSPNKGVSRLWSRSRRSVDEGTTGTKSTTRSRFTEEPSTGSESASSPTSPSSSRFKVPLKDKIKGELKIISGKVSRNEAKVEQGVALKTGQDPTSPTVQKH